MKYCTGCEQTKELTEFYKDSQKRDGLQSRCKVCIKAYKKKWYQNNREKHNAKSKKWQQNNREKRNASAKKWQQNNREKHNASARKYYQNNREKHNALVRKSSKCPEAKKRINARLRERRKTDPQFRLAHNLRSRLRKALKGKNKSASTMTLLGCSIPHLKDHLEKQFIPGMTWANQGKWHIDHMMPCASFELAMPNSKGSVFITRTSSPCGVRRT